MTSRIDRIDLPGPAPGTDRHLTVHRFGVAGARPKVWLQAALHASELPGSLVLHHLMVLLAEAEGRGEIVGELRVAPLANPIGAAQAVGGRHVGRFALDGGGNFNRGFADLRETLTAAVAGKLTDDAAANIALVRVEIMRLLGEQRPTDDASTLKLTLQKLAADADIALDLHCDDQAALHFYCGPRHADAFASLAARLGAVALLTAEDSGDAPFDESLTRPWWRLIDAVPDKPVPADGMLACTVELRGEADIDDATARADAGAIFAWLQERGVLAGTPPPAPPALCLATPLDGADNVRAPAAGLWVPRVRPGSTVAAGDHLGDILDPTASPGKARTPVVGPIAGLLFARAVPGMVPPGARLAAIAGPTSLPGRKGNLLSD